MLDHLQLKKILPQAYPFLLLDRVEAIQPGVSLIATKNITANEWPFTECHGRLAHYPQVLLIEAAAQAALVLFRANKIEDTIKHAYIGKVKAEFFSEVQIGDQVQFNVKSTRSFGSGGYSDVDVNVAEEKKAEITAFFSIPK